MDGLIRHLGSIVKRNAPTILTCIGAGGVIATAVATAKATPKAQQLIIAATVEKGKDLTKGETVRAAAPAYIPAVITGAATIACIFGANILNKRSQAALMSAYALLDNSYKEYKDKLIELHGEDIDLEVRQALMQGKYEAIDEAANQKKLYFDFYSMRYFDATDEEVRAAEDRFNRNYAIGGYACLNEFYDALGLSRIESGYELGWSIYSDGVYKIDFFHEAMVLNDGTEVTVISMPLEPNVGYIY